MELRRIKTLISQVINQIEKNANQGYKISYLKDNEEIEINKDSLIEILQDSRNKLDKFNNYNNNNPIELLHLRRQMQRKLPKILRSS